MNNLPFDFDVYYYKLLNDDLKNMTNDQLIKHYLEYGKNENRLYKFDLPNDFDIEFYKNNYNDLKNFSIDELKLHYILHGKLENRIYKSNKNNFLNNLPSDFNLVIYKNNYIDLYNFTDEQLINHYLSHGKNENRIYNKIIKNDNRLNKLSKNLIDKLPIDFNIDIYKNNYIDLYNFTDEELINHYLIHGKNENRIYNINKIEVPEINKLPKDFDINFYKNKYDDLKNFNNKELVNHYINYGKKENRLYNNYKYNIINNLDLTEINVDYVSNLNKSNIIISLTTIPPRFIESIFEKVILSLYNQIVKPDFIVINLCYKYNRTFKYDIEKYNEKIDYYKNKYKNLIINITEDFGPITKILGLYNIISTLGSSAIIIVVDDDWICRNYLTYYYLLIYQLYQCDCVFIDEFNLINWNNNINNNLFINNINQIFYDNYQSYVFGWLSFSFKQNYIQKLYNFYNKIITYNVNLIKHDDLILTLFYKIDKLYACGINIFMFENNRLILDELFALRNEKNSFILRTNLEKKYLSIYNIEYNIINNRIKILNNKKFINKVFINKKINERNLLFNIENIDYDPEKNDFENKQLDIKYFNKNIFILTITYFNNNIEKEINVFNNKINNENIYSNKISYFIQVNYDLIKIDHKKYNFKIMQTYNNNEISLFRHYSICTILNYIPDIKYIFFDENDRIKYLENNYIYSYLYNKLNVYSYKADLFRAIYIYENGGLYLDCKNILYTHIHYLLNKNECYVLDLENRICNGFIYCNYKNNHNIKNYILEILYNIHNSLYLNSSLEITGPELFKKYIHNQIYLKNTFHNIWNNSFLLDINTHKIIIKNSYPSYYEENNYLNTIHYGILYEKKLVYNNILIDYHKINGISHILWINLERSHDRRINMIELLKNINIPNIRINAIDGNKKNIHDMIKVEYEKKLSNYELACTLSHIKAINYCFNLDGDYFMIIEDDISFNNLNLFDYDLNKIIQESPNFDILLINKTLNESLENDYTNWNEYLKNKHQISSTVCYIISRNGINKIFNDCEYINDDNFIFKTNKKMNVADMYLYINNNTYVYKYNYINLKIMDSTIHNDHKDYHTICDKYQQYEIFKNLVI
jgi:GR25 family glycosyltransferase involved in LPS biosynthesis